MGAVTAEHGLYYDTEWDLDFETSPSGDSASLIFSIQDTDTARSLLNDPMSTGGFSSWSPEPMKNYPTANATFKFKVTLRKGEKFLRTECIVENDSNECIQTEAWILDASNLARHQGLSDHLSPEETPHQGTKWCLRH